MAVNVVYSSSDLYAQCTGISIYSLLVNNQDIEELNIYILDTDISAENKNKILRTAAEYNRSIEFIPAQEQFNKNIERYNLSILRGSYNTYARVMLNTWFSFLDKILFIDSDTLVIGSIKKLWETDLQGNLMAAVPEAAVYAKGCLSEDTELVDSYDYYYNMGIGLYDLKRWREENIDELIVSEIKKYDKCFYIADQSILNYTINNRMLRMHLKYNYYTAAHGVKYKTLVKNFSKKVVFSEVEFNEARQNPVIIHFVGHPFERPWYAKSSSPYKPIYDEYRKKTLWSGETLLKTPSSKNFIFFVYDYMTYLFIRLHMYNFSHWFRYILGQRIKKIVRQNR